MEHPISMVEAKSKLADLVGQVAYADKRFILERRGRPMAVLISVDEYRRLQELERTAGGQPLPPELGRRQAQLIAQAHRLRARLGDRVGRAIGGSHALFHHYLSLVVPGCVDSG